MFVCGSRCCRGQASTCTNMSLRFRARSKAGCARERTVILCYFGKNLGWGASWEDVGMSTRFGGWGVSVVCKLSLCVVYAERQWKKIECCTLLILIWLMGGSGNRYGLMWDWSYCRLSVHAGKPWNTNYCEEWIIHTRRGSNLNSSGSVMYNFIKKNQSKYLLQTIV